MVRALVDRARALTGNLPIVTLVGGTAAAQAIALAATPLLTRLYGPAQMGELGLFTAFIGVAGVMVSGRYELAIPGATNDDDALSLVRLALGLSIILGIASAAGLAMLQGLSILSYEILPWWSAPAALPAIVAFGWFSALRYWHLRHRRFGDISRVMLVQSGARVATSVGMGFASASSGGLLVGEVAGRVLGVARLLAGLRRQVSWRGLATGPVAAVARRYRSFPSLLLPSTLLDVAALSLPVPLIAHYFGAAAAGTFLTVQRLSLLPAALVATGAGDVLHVSAVDALASGDGAARRLLHRSFWRLLAAALMIFVPLAVAAPLALPRFLGAGWNDAAPVFIALVPWSIANLVVSPLSRILAVSDHKHRKLVYDVLALVALVVAIVGCSRAGWDLATTITVTGAVQVLAYAVYFLLIRSACPSTGAGVSRAVP
jgi:O-antigen/teichoic acid export membrane protein